MTSGNGAFAVPTQGVTIVEESRKPTSKSDFRRREIRVLSVRSWRRPMDVAIGRHHVMVVRNRHVCTNKTLWFRSSPVPDRVLQYSEDRESNTRQGDRGC